MAVVQPRRRETAPRTAAWVISRVFTTSTGCVHAPPMSAEATPADAKDVGVDEAAVAEEAAFEEPAVAEESAAEEATIKSAAAEVSAAVEAVAEEAAKEVEKPAKTVSTRPTQR